MQCAHSDVSVSNNNFQKVKCGSGRPKFPHICNQYLICSPRYTENNQRNSERVPYRKVRSMMVLAMTLFRHLPEGLHRLHADHAHAPEQVDDLLLVIGKPVRVELLNLSGVKSKDGDGAIST
jgi:hypothetical protein